MFPILKILTPTILKTIMKYVQEPNELDYKVKEHDTRLNSHSDRLIAIEKKIKRLK